LAISVSNKLLWILSIAHFPLTRHIDQVCDTEPEVVEFRLDFLFWYDGAKMRGNHKGVFSAIKIVDAYLVIDGEKALLSDSLLRNLQSIAWVLVIARCGETRINVRQLEKSLLSQWGDIVSNSAPEFDFTYQNIRLVPRLLGFVADHGIRQKSLSLNSQLAARCGECTFLFFSAAPYAFLDWLRICSSEPCTIANWAETHFADLPEHMTLWHGVESEGFLTYDNHHNIVGLFEDLFHIFMSFIPRGVLMERVTSELRTLTRVSAKGKPRGSKLPDHRFYQGYHWRLVSLHLKDILAPLWNGELVSNTFATLFDLFTEIHVFNYVHWKRDEPEFQDVRARYAVVLYQFTLQLRYAIPEEKISEMDAMYAHKVFGHSPKLFRHYNLAACSCEQGEGIISVINRLLRNTSGSYEARLRKVFLQLTMFEEQKMATGLKRGKSVVFDDFFTKYAPPTLSLSLKVQEYRSFMALFEYCDLVSDERPLGVLIRYDRNRSRYLIDCLPNAMETMLQKSTSRDGVSHANIERSTLCLQVQRDRLRTPLIKEPQKQKAVPQETYTVRLRNRLASLLEEIEEQLGLLSRGVSNYAHKVMARVRDMEGNHTNRWVAKQGEPSLASRLDLYPPKNNWEASFKCKEDSTTPVKERKSYAKERFEREILARPWIQEINEGFNRAIAYFLTVHGDVLYYHQPHIENASPDDIISACSIVEASVELLDVYSKWNRSLVVLAELFYSICYNVGLISKNEELPDEEIDSDFEDGEMSESEHSYYENEEDEQSYYENEIEESEEELFQSDCSSEDEPQYDSSEDDEELFESDDEAMD